MELYPCDISYIRFVKGWKKLFNLRPHKFCIRFNEVLKDCKLLDGLIIHPSIEKMLEYLYFCHSTKHQYKYYEKHSTCDVVTLNNMQKDFESPLNKEYKKLTINRIHASRGGQKNSNFSFASDKSQGNFCINNNCNDKGRNSNCHSKNYLRASYCGGHGSDHGCVWIRRCGGYSNSPPPQVTTHLAIVAMTISIKCMMINTTTTTVEIATVTTRMDIVVILIMCKKSAVALMKEVIVSLAALMFPKL